MAQITVLELQKKKTGNQKISMVTAYDYTMARLVDQAGVDMVLVGDSLGMVIQGDDNTLSVTIEDMVYHSRCVAKGLSNAHLTVDMPFMTYQVSPEIALQNAGRLIQEGKAQSVKLEGGEQVAPTIKKIVQAGIPVVGHIGLTPQSVHVLGGFKVQGKAQEAQEKLLLDALALEDAGASLVVLELVPKELAKRISERLHIPTIGIGAGVHCDGQVLVCNDLLGLDLRFKPRFLKRYATLEENVLESVRSYVRDVQDGSFPTDKHSFTSERKSSKLRRLY
ncbi:MAG: 3-methyl-2-oxobutanoate hydroxymethyltransferase [Deltaproteobacteria bacterium]|nr:3-methyl-2-oxobutanoate hydroxymethyltransferase [Deltaproteobacteria bacterium]